MAAPAELHRLHRSVVGHLTEGFKTGEQTAIDVDNLVEPYRREVGGAPRPVTLERLAEVLADFEERKSGFDDPAKSDRWLAPRLHAALRLTRREATQAELWNWLTIQYAPDYVRWRFPYQPPASGETGSHSRFVGERKKQAFSRLWWSAEMFRNGTDYGPVEQALQMQDIPNSFLSYDCFESRPLAIAVIGRLATLNDGAPATSDEVKQLGRSINLWLSTTVIEDLAPDAADDPGATWHWVTDPNPDPIGTDELPEGPDDGAVAEESLDRAAELIDELIETVRGYRRDHSAAEAPETDADE